mgnify:CR=1 FL=1
MNTTLESTGKLTAQIRLHIDPADYAPQVKEELKKQAKKANMPGFRPGKVPIGIVRRMVGRSVVVETINEMVNQELQDYIKGEKLNLVGDPLITEQKSEEDFDPNAEKEMDFVFDVGFAPEFELNFEIDDLPVRYEVTIDDEYLNETLEQYQERFGGVENPETYEKGDIMYGKVYEADEEGNAVEDGFEQMVPFNPIRFENDAFFEPFYGANLDDEFDLDIKTISEDTEKLAELLFIEADQVEELKNKKLKLQVKRMNRLNTAELNQEFFERMGEELEWEDVDYENMDADAFKEKMRETLAEPQNENAKWFYRNKLRDKIIENHPLEFPDEFLKRWLLKTNEKLDEAKLAEEYPDYVRSLTWSLIVDKMVEANPQIQVTEEDINAELIGNLRNQFLRMGMPLPPDREQEFLQMAQQNQEMVNNAIQSVIATKVFDALDEQIIPERETISSKEFQALLEKEEEKNKAEQAAKLDEAAQFEEVTPEPTESEEAAE